MIVDNMTGPINFRALAICLCTVVNVIVDERIEDTERFVIVLSTEDPAVQIDLDLTEIVILD